MHYARLPASEAHALAACRTQPGWEVCVEGDQLWVRADQPVEDLWRGLPFAERCTADAAQRLIRQGQSVPVRRVPEQAWVALRHWMPVQRSASLPSGVRPPPVMVRPVRVSDRERAADLVLVSRSTWETWAVTAPQARLEPLRFALSSDGRVCVRGLPLPPLPGEAWGLHQGIALRAGFDFPPVCTPAWLARMLDVPQGGLALWHEDGSSEVLPASAFIPATRANVRASAAGMMAND